MLTERQIEALEGRIAKIYEELEKEVICDVARRIKKTGRFTETAELQATFMRDLGYSPEKIQREAFKILNSDREYREFVTMNTLDHKKFVKEQIKATERQARREGNKIIADAGDMSFNYDLILWEQSGKWLRKGSEISNLIDKMVKRTQKDLKNITKTMGFVTQNSFQPLIDLYQHQLDLALIKCLSGAFSFDQCVIDCVKDLSHSGLKTVQYASGKKMSADSVARMCIRTASNQLSGEISLSNCKSSGEDLVEVSEHWGARPSHQEWQGKIYSLSGTSRKYGDFYEETHYGEADGLCGVNCRHTFFPYFDGISEPTKWEKEPEPTQVNGKTYTYYEATQQQRKYERSIRENKKILYGLNAIGEKEEANKTKNIIRKQIAEYKSFSNTVGISAKMNRIRVAGE